MFGMEITSIQRISFDNLFKCLRFMKCECESAKKWRCHLAPSIVISILRIIKHLLHVCTRHSFSELFDSRRRDIVFPGDMFPKSEDWDDEDYEENHVATGQRKANKSEGKPGVMTRWR